MISLLATSASCCCCARTSLYRVLPEWEADGRRGQGEALLLRNFVPMAQVHRSQRGEALAVCDVIRSRTCPKVSLGGSWEHLPPGSLRNKAETSVALRRVPFGFARYPDLVPLRPAFPWPVPGWRLRLCFSWPPSRGRFHVLPQGGAVHPGAVGSSQPCQSHPEVIHQQGRAWAIAS